MATGVLMVTVLSLLTFSAAPTALAGTISFGGDLGTASSNGACSAPPSTVTSDADNYTEQNNPDTVKDPSHQDLHIHSKAGSVGRGFVHFPMPPAVPMGCQVASATLDMVSQSYDLGRTLQVRRAASSWTDTTITWNTQPAPTGDTASLASGPSYSFDVTQHVRDIYADDNYGFVIQDAAEGDGSDAKNEPYSMEGATPPSLTINWEPANSDSLTITLGTAVPAGGSVIVSFAMEDVSGSVTATDTAGNTYSVDADASHEDISRTLILSAHDVAPLSAGDTVTISHPTASSRAGSVASFTGLSPSATLDQAAGSAGTDGAPSSGTVTTTQDEELVIGAVTADAVAAFTPGSGFTALTGATSNSGTVTPEYQIVSVTGSYEGNGTLSASSEWSAVVATYRMDLDAPSPAITQPPAATNDSTPTVAGTAGDFNSDSTSVTVRLYQGPDTSGTLLDTLVATRDGAGDWSVDVAGALAEGTYTLQAEQGDLGGNIGQSVPVTFIVDTTAPAAPSLDTTPPTEGNDTSVSWGFSGEGSATFECRLTNGALVVSDWGVCSSPDAHTLADGDGTYTFSVRQTDQAGNTSAAATFDYLLDTVAPTVTITGSPASPGNDLNPVWDFTTEPGATTECSLDGPGGQIDPAASCATSYTFDLTGQPDGDHTFFVEATDLAGNTGAADTHVYKLDTTGPSVSIDSAPTSPGNGAAPMWTFSTEPGATTECELRDDSGVIDPAASCSGSYSFDLSGSADGDYTLGVRATDALGNIGPETTNTYSFDTTGPAVTFTSVPGPTGGNPNPTWTFTTEPGATTTCSLIGPSGIVDPATACSSPYSFDLSALPDGAYTLSVVAEDAAGNQGAIAQNGYVYDTSGPVISLLDGPNVLGNDPAPTWTFSVPAGASATCQLSGPLGEVIPAAPCAGSYTADLSDYADGVYTLTIQATDPWGNPGPIFATSYTLDRTAPSVEITSSPQSPGNDRTPRWTFSVEGEGAAECRLTRGGAEVVPYSPCSGLVGFPLLGEPDGEYVIGIRATDLAGNTSDPVTGTYLLDTEGPDTTITSGPTSGQNVQPKWKFISENGATFECRVSKGSSLLTHFGSCSSPYSFDLTGRAPGIYTFAVRATDEVGNRGDVAQADYELLAPDEEEEKEETGSEPEETSQSPDDKGMSGSSGSTDGERADQSSPDTGGTPSSEPSDPNSPDEPDRTGVLGKNGRKVDDKKMLEPDDTQVEESASGAAPTTGSTPARASSEEPADGSSVLTTIRSASIAVAKGATFPAVLLLLIFAFLLFQDRVDRSDPKLALAPVHPDPYVDFTPG